MPSGGYTIIFAGKRSHLRPGTVTGEHLVEYHDDYEDHKWVSSYIEARTMLANYFAGQAHEWAELARNTRYLTQREFVLGVTVPERVRRDKRRQHLRHRSG